MSVSKRIACIILSCLLVCLPLIQRSNAVVGVDDVAITIILTLLLAMGITLVIADMKNDQYIASRTAEFLQSIGAGAQSFGQWLLGSDSALIDLKNGFLSLPETIVTKGKQFINWLVPNPASNTVIDLSFGGSGIPTDFIYSVSHTSGGGFKIDSVGRLPGENASTDNIISYSDGQNTVNFESQSFIKSTGYYQATTGNYVNSSIAVGGYYAIVFIAVKQAFQYNTNILALPGVYLGGLSQNSNIGSNINVLMYTSTGCYMFDINSIDSDIIEAAAIIGNYDDLSGLEDTEVESSGTTVINNTFYITQDGQALNPDSQSLDDIIGALQDAIDSINQKIDVIGWTQADTAEGTLTPDYSDFELGNLNFTQLGALITTRFPFSIPWDLVRIFQLFVADPQPPSWTFDILPADNFANIDTEITLDLSQYPIIGTISRWFCVIDLCLGLVFASKKLIWTA